MSSAYLHFGSFSQKRIFGYNTAESARCKSVCGMTTIAFAN